MNSAVNEITKSIIGKISLYESDTDELQQLTSLYPFFGPAQFLLAKRLKQENSPLFSKQIQKASLYFKNPVWFDHLLSDTGAGQNQITGKNENAFFMPLVQMENPATYEVVPDQTKTEQSDNTIPEEQPGQNHPELSEVFPKYKFEQIATSKAEIQATNEEYPDQTKTEHPDDTIHGEQPEQNQPELSVVFPKSKFEPGDPSKVEIPATFEEVVDQSKTEQIDDMINKEQPEQNLPPLSVEFTKFKFEPVDPSKAELTFEPYHTIDYFASQGIRNKEEEKPKDQLSRQLKSFTEWLKIMKRLPVSEIAATVSATDEKKVEKMAEISINDREVVTEAMAEVWEKQGNKAKAIEVYQKLSLLNPAKSSYFAAKIEQLKNL